MRFYGIKHLYPRLGFLGRKLRAVLANSRPFTLLLPLVGGYFVIQTSLTHWVFPTPDPLKTLAALTALLLINAFGNNINAIYDVEIDRVNKPYRPIPAGILSTTETWGASLVMLILALGLSSLVGWVFYSLVNLLGFLTYVYSKPPLRLKRLLWINNIHQAFIRGILGVLAAWSIYAPITLQALGLAGVLFLLILAAQSSKDFVDVEGDRRFGIRTLPVVYGTQKTIQYMADLMSLPFLLSTLLILVGVFPVTAGTFVILVPVALVFLRSLQKPSQTLENSRGWALFYGMMLATLGIFSLVL